MQRREPLVLPGRLVVRAQQIRRPSRAGRSHRARARAPRSPARDAGSPAGEIARTRAQRSSASVGRASGPASSFAISTSSASAACGWPTPACSWRLEDVEQIRVAAGLAIQPRELGRARARPARRARSPGAASLEIDDLEERGDRLAQLLEHDLVDLRDAREQDLGILAGHRRRRAARDHALGQPARRRDRLDLAAQDIDQIAPALGRLVQPLERVQRAGVVRLIREHVAPRRDRGRAIGQLVLFERGDAREQRRAAATDPRPTRPACA